jgi:hypothetical protein
VSNTSLRLLIVFVCTAGSLMLLQSAFDESDHRKAERAVRGYLVAGRALGPFVEARAPGGAWSTEITHGCRGIVRVRYDAPGGRYELDYDLPAHTIHPGNEPGRAALEAFTERSGSAAPR